MKEPVPIESITYSCPHCKGELHTDHHSCICENCNRRWQIHDDIPDFISDSRDSNLESVFNVGRKADWVAPIYENALWYQSVFKFAGAHSSSLKTVTAYHSESLKEVSGNILDAACGTATYSRRLTTPLRQVYGIDISMNMLTKGLKYTRRDNVSGVHLCRARVEELPFKDETFDGAICSGSLHLFPDTFEALREIARTMKPGAPFSVQTFIKGSTIVNSVLDKHRWFQNYTLSELKQYLAEAGFSGFESQMDGPIVLMLRVYKTA